MRRRYSLVMGLVLVAAMLAGQASVSVLAQSTPVAPSTPGAKEPAGVTVDLLGTTKNLLDTKYNLFLVGITVNYNSQFSSKDISPEEQNIASTLLYVDSGQFRVTIESAKEVTLKIGSGGPIYDGNGKTIVCEVDCNLLKDHPDVKSVTLKPGNSISIKNGVFIVASEEPVPATPAALSFQGRSGHLTGPVVSYYCLICPP